MLITVINFLLSLSLLIVLHELGHFIPARLFKTRVEKFFLFFDVKFSLFKKKIGETVYGIGWLPLGGYVKISGMIDESMDKEQLEKPAEPWEFRSKPAWQRLIIMLGGVIVNVIVGFVIYITLVFTQGTVEDRATDTKYGYGYPKVLEEVGFAQGDRPILVNGDSLLRASKMMHYLMFRDVEEVTVLRNDQTVNITIPEDIGSRLFTAGVRPILMPRTPFVLDSIQEGSQAEKIGVQPGDKIVSIGGYPVKYSSDYTYAMNEKVKINEDAEVVYESNGVMKTGTIRFGQVEEKGLLSTKMVDEEKIFGIFRRPVSDDFYKTRDVQHGFGASISQGISQGVWTMRDYISQFKYIFTKKGAGQLGGFATIAKLYPDSFDWVAFWSTTALISFILAIMNILPIPALDGGHVMFLLYEIITGRKPGDKFLERAQIIGILLLLGLLLYANGNDVYRAITGA